MNETPDHIDVVQEATKYLGVWQSRLRLLDWDIWVVEGAVNPNHSVESSPEWRSHRASITFPSDYLQRERTQGEHKASETDSEIVEHGVIHELLHIMEQPMASMVQGEINWLVGPANDDAGVLGAELRNQWRDYRGWVINQVVRILIAAFDHSDAFDHSNELSGEMRSNRHKCTKGPT